jgi:hypothetical protein
MLLKVCEVHYSTIIPYPILVATLDQRKGLWKASTSLIAECVRLHPSDKHSSTEWYPYHEYESENLEVVQIIKKKIIPINVALATYEDYIEFKIATASNPMDIERLKDRGLRYKQDVKDLSARDLSNKYGIGDDLLSK